MPRLAVLIVCALGGAALPARADCIADVPALLAQAARLPNAMARQAATVELRAAIEDGTEDGEDYCVHRRTIAERIMRDQPYDLPPTKPPGSVRRIRGRQAPPAE